MVSAISNQGKVRFMIYKEAMNADLMIKFMKRLLTRKSNMQRNLHIKLPG
jgi:hypothetical protein